MVYNQNILKVCITRINSNGTYNVTKSNDDGEEREAIMELGACCMELKDKNKDDVDKLWKFWMLPKPPENGYLSVVD